MGEESFGKGIELAGKTLGLIGCGRIGSLVAGKALTLGMELLFHAIDFADVPGAYCVSLNTLLADADFISLHVPYTPQTRHIIGANELAKVESVYIVNTGRGGTSDEKALYDAIISGRVAGAALDVFEDEREDRGRQLMELPQVIGSPRIGSGTVEAKKRVGEAVARIAIEFTERRNQEENYGNDQTFSRRAIQSRADSRSFGGCQPTPRPSAARPEGSILRTESAQHHTYHPGQGVSDRW